MKKISIVILICLSLFSVIFYLYINLVLSAKVDFQSEEIIEVPRGASTSSVIAIFNRYNAFEPAWLFKFYLSISMKSDKKFIKAGFYKFDSTMTNRKLIEALQSGTHQYSIKLTFPEGLTYHEIASIIESRLKIPRKHFITLCESDSLLNARGIVAENVEGYLLPNTYDFHPNSDEKVILDRLLNEHESFWTNKIAQQMTKISLTKHEILTLASIIEAETPVDAEKAKVSGLYHNRLNKNMLLQADPTVQYGIGNKQRLLYRDLESNSKYNTYKHAGLPPGPINNPGSKAIIAAIEPEEHNYIYMVATPDNTGWHNFSETYSKHMEFVKEYRKWYKNREK